MTKAEHTIDLQCTLCKKNPKFSDVSHLLTHIASKSHLAARFKLDIQSKGGDEDAKSKLDYFDFWYNTSNIDTLLAERMAMKDNKTKKSRKSTASSNASVCQHIAS
jgi:hypothetical protein